MSKSQYNWHNNFCVSLPLVISKVRINDDMFPSHLRSTPSYAPFWLHLQYWKWDSQLGKPQLFVESLVLQGMSTPESYSVSQRSKKPSLIFDIRESPCCAEAYYHNINDWGTLACCLYSTPVYAMGYTYCTSAQITFMKVQTGLWDVGSF